MSYESRDQLFLYHAYALGCGGYLERNWNKLNIPSVGSAVVPITGGEVCTRNEPFVWAPPCEPEPPRGFRLSVGEVTTHVWTEEDKDSWTSNAEVRVSNFDLCGRVQIGLMVNRMTSKHKKRTCEGFDPERDRQPRISFKGSQYWNVSVDGEAVTLPIHDELDRCQTHDELKAMIRTDAANGGKFCSQSLISCAREAPEFARDLAEKFKSEKYTRCSIVRELSTSERMKERVCGYAMEVPDLGRIFFGEMFVNDGMKRLNMIRWDLGCDNCGGGTGGGSFMNGETMP